MSKANNYLGSTILLIGLVSVSFLAGLTQAKPKIDQTQASSLQSYDQLEVFHQNYVIFITDIFLKRDKTRVKFPFAFTDKVNTIWLGFDPTDPDNRTEILVSHPQLNDLSWNLISQGNLNLFQRQKQFETIDQFLASQVDPQKVAIDSLLKDDYPKFEESQNTDFEIDLQNKDFILTTYRHSEYENGVYYFERIIDATSAKLLDEKSIQWHLRAPDVNEENTYKRGIIDVNYLQ